MKAITGILFVGTLVFGSGCAQTDWIDRTLVTVDVTGSWYGRVEGTVPSGDIQLELEQQGATVKGSIRFTGGSASQGGGITGGSIDGTVAGDVFRLRDSRGGLEGELTISGDEMNGRVSLMGTSRPLSLRRVDPSSRPASPPR